MRDEVYIVAGGTSLENFNFNKLKGKDVIAINKAILDMSTAKYFITMDYTLLTHKLNKNIHLFNQSKATKFFVANLCPKYMMETNGRIMDTRSNFIYKLNPFHVVIKSKKEKPIGLDFSSFAHGENSGFCGLQLAICLGYKHIHLLGYDFSISSTKTHYHDGYVQSKEHFKDRLKDYLTYLVDALTYLNSACPEISIYNYSDQEEINELLIKCSLDDIYE